MIRHKLVAAFVSVGIILFSAELTYFALGAATIKKLPTLNTTAHVQSQCVPEPISGELIVKFSDDFSEQMQDRIIMANKGNVIKRTYLSEANQYSNIVKVDAGSESDTLRLLHQTPGVVSAEQNTTGC